MARVASSFPNLVGGTSQQPPEIRQLNCSTALTNTFSSTALGLTTRQASAFIGSAGLAPRSSTSVATHPIDRASGRFEIAVADGTPRVTKIAPNGTTVLSVVIEDNAAAYLATNDPAKDIGFVTVGDTTFIFNRSVTCRTLVGRESGATGRSEDDGVVRRSPNRHSTFWVRQRGQGELNFTLYIDGSEKANKLVANGDGNGATIYTALANAMRTAGFAVQDVHRSLGVVTHATDGVRLKASDDYGNEGMVAYNGSVVEFTNLPNVDIDGRLILVSHNAEQTSDDYWVYFNGEAWVETYGWDAYETLDASTMPVILVHDVGTGVWTLKRTTWPGRSVGDGTSNPSPSFVGRQINSMFLYKGRMIILADENVVASRVGDFERFYRTTCSQLLDDDPFDIAAPDSHGAALVYARNFDQSLLVFSTADQYRLDGDSDGVVSPNSVAIKHVNSYNASALCAPVYCGPNVLFVDDFTDGQHAQVMEYQIDKVLGRQTALPTTDQVPEYIPTGVYQLCESSTRNVVVALSKGDRKKLWLYNYHFTAEGKAQSAWQIWELPGKAYGANFLGELLYVLIEVNGELFWVAYDFSLSTDVVMDDRDILLDFSTPQGRCVVTRDGNDTLVTLPYNVAANQDLCLVISTANTGKLPQGKDLYPTAIEGRTLRFARVNLVGEQFRVGYQYTLIWDLSPVYLRDQKGVAIQDGRLQLRHITLLYNNSGAFEVHVTPNGRETYVSTYSGFRLGNNRDILGKLTLDNGEFRVTTNGAADTVNIRVIAKTPWRVRFSSLEWDGVVKTKFKRV